MDNGRVYTAMICGIDTGWLILWTIMASEIAAAMHPADWRRIMRNEPSLVLAAQLFIDSTNSGWPEWVMRLATMASSKSPQA